MATKKPTTAKTSSPKKTTSAAKTSTKPRTSSATTVRTAPAKRQSTGLPANLINIVVAEAVGTFALTLAALYALPILPPLYVGLTLIVLVLAVGSVSGAHLNPAVTFGLWTMRKLSGKLLPFYWAAQMLGAMAAVVLLGGLSLGSFSLHFDEFMQFSWGIFGVELVGMMLFMFGIAAAVLRKDIQQTGKAVGIGLSLSAALIVTSTLLPVVQNTAVTQHRRQQEQQAQDDASTAAKQTLPREIYINGATLNPAVALASTKKTESQLQGSQQPQPDEKLMSRLSLEVIAATLIGAALGGNLFLLVNYRAKTEEE